MALTKYELLNAKPSPDFIKISSHGIKGSFFAYQFQDADTKQFVLYIPSFEISAYGESMKKAQEMLKASIDDCLEHIFNLSVKEQKQFLSNFGWKMNNLHHKEFSKAYIDAKGELKGFNAVENSIQLLTVTA